jgi:hypothetical protein
MVEAKNDKFREYPDYQDVTLKRVSDKGDTARQRGVKPGPRDKMAAR